MTTSSKSDELAKMDESYDPDEPAKTNEGDETAETNDSDPSVLIVGPTGIPGGIAQYIDAQREHLADTVDFEHYNVAIEPGSGLLWLCHGIFLAFVDAVLFPFRVRDPPDVVHVHTAHRRSFYRASWYVLFISWIRGWPVALHVHGSSFDTFIQDASRPVRSLQRTVFGAADAVVTLSEGWADVVSARAPEDRIVVLPNAVDTDAYRADPGGDPPRIAFISNHVERKGITEFVDAIDGLLEAQDRSDPFRVDVAGDGPLSDRATDLANRRDAVSYHGYVSEERKRDLLAEASVFVLPTYAEGLPIAVLEGMAGANAIVSTDVGAIPSIVDDRNGVLVDPGDTDELRAALESFVAETDRIREMGEISRRRIEEGYDWNGVSNELYRLYGQLSAGEKPDLD